MDHRDFQAALRLGEIALLGNCVAKAEEQLRRAVTLSPDEKRPKEVLAEVLYRQDRFEEAAAMRRDVGPDAVADKLADFKGIRPYETPGDMESTEVKFVQTDPLPIIRARINGGDEVYLLIDTGVAELYLDPEFAGKIGVTRFGETTGTYAGGKQAATGHGRVESLQLGEFTIRNPRLPWRQAHSSAEDGRNACFTRSACELCQHARHPILDGRKPFHGGLGTHQRE